MRRSAAMLRIVAISCALATPGALWAQTAPVARPGNDIGTGQSLPTSNKASNITPGDTSTEIAPRLPDPDAKDVAGLLRAARASLLSGRTGEAQEALERAETRLLDRSIRIGTQDQAIRDPMVRSIEQARGRLGAGDRAGAAGIVDKVLSSLPG